MEDRGKGNSQKNGYLYSKEKGKKIDLHERTCLKTFNFQKHYLFEGTKLDGNVKELPYARNILKTYPHYPMSKEQHFLLLVSEDKLPSCGFNIYFLSTKVGSY